ncbi:hypothetical protein BKA62DRAFT_677021 [Auriculariales sp. MPI-PUGE-AT-0066]|nr:hypothetical protein BKA62DRAFT_677021 [Auriculariales sp. MPI-PUGE-AT-0066]
MADGRAPARKRIVASATSSHYDTPKRLQPVPRPTKPRTLTPRPPTPNSRKVRFHDEDDEDWAVRVRAESILASIARAAKANPAADLTRCVVCEDILDVSHCRWLPNGYACLSCTRSNSAGGTDTDNPLDPTRLAYEIETGKDARGRETRAATTSFSTPRGIPTPTPSSAAKNTLPAANQVSEQRKQTSGLSEAEYRDIVRRVKLTPKRNKSFCQLCCRILMLCTFCWITVFAVGIVLLYIL